MIHLLDNPVWNALETGNKNLALGEGAVKWFREDIAPFAGLKDNSLKNMEMLYESTPKVADFFSILSVNELKIPAPWRLMQAIPLLQMVCENPKFRTDFRANIVPLSDENIPQMLELTQLTRPGPFRARTIDFGHYQGIFEGEQLVAMAGQRMHAVPFAEVSAVCTHPRFTGLGYAAQLMKSQILRMRAADEIPFLHVAAENVRAIKIYEAMGFVIRSKMNIYLINK